MWAGKFASGVAMLVHTERLPPTMAYGSDSFDLDSRLSSTHYLTRLTEAAVLFNFLLQLLPNDRFESPLRTWPRIWTAPW